MERLKMPEGEPIEHPLVTRSIESAQRKVEAHNFDIRKQLLEYDDVANDQRRTVYTLRNTILEGSDLSDQVKALRDGVISDLLRAHIPLESVEEQWDVAGLERALMAELQVDVPLQSMVEADASLSDDDLLARILERADALYLEKMAVVPAEQVREYERWLLLHQLDSNWREHLAALDHLRQGIHLRGYAQKNPKQEYKREAFELFGHFLETVKLEVTRVLMNVKIKTPEQVVQVEHVAPAVENVQYRHASYEEALATAATADESAPAAQVPFKRAMGKVGRNDPCPCGSGKKYKHCHGQLS
jgi:preprotein translocase subunit SecA